MPEHPESSTPPVPDGAPVLVQNGAALMFNGFPVGTVETVKVTLNLGWCRLAGLHVRVEADPQYDGVALRNHQGVLLDRDPRAVLGGGGS